MSTPDWAAHRATEYLQDAAVEGDDAIVIQLNFEHAITVSSVGEAVTRQHYIEKASLFSEDQLITATGRLGGSRLIGPNRSARLSNDGAPPAVWLKSCG